MKPTLYLHIGCHRTATTSIQQFLETARQHLLAKGILVPFATGRNNLQLDAVLNGQIDARHLSEDLCRRAASKPTPIHSIILSDEDVSMRENLDPLEGLREAFDIKVIFSLRRQDEWLESWYFQNVKWQWMPHLAHATFDEFMAHYQTIHWIDYDAYVRMLEAIFGHENVILTLFEPDRMPDGPVADFAKLIGLHDLKGFPAAPHVNESLSTEMTEFVRHLPLDTLEDPERDLVVRLLQRIDHVDRAGVRRTSAIMPADQRQEVMAYYSEGNRALAQRYFSRTDLFSSPAPNPSDPIAQMRLPGTSKDLIDRFIAPLIVELATAPPPPERVAQL